MKFRPLVLACSFAMGLAFGARAQTAGQDIKNAGHETKDASKDAAKATGKAVKTGAHKTKEAVKHGTHATASATERGADKVKEKTE
jgi:hypothetical protein